VFLMGRSVSAGMTLAAGAVVAMVWCCCGGVTTGKCFCMCMYVYGSELLKAILYGGVLAQTASKQGISQAACRVLKKAGWTYIPMSSARAVRCRSVCYTSNTSPAGNVSRVDDPTKCKWSSPTTREERWSKLYELLARLFTSSQSTWHAWVPTNTVDGN
jgi:hypothetical protein